jgi:hypothetical protein
MSYAESMFHFKNIQIEQQKDQGLMTKVCQHPIKYAITTFCGGERLQVDYPKQPNCNTNLVTKDKGCLPYLSHKVCEWGKRQRVRNSTSGDKNRRGADRQLATFGRSDQGIDGRKTDLEGAF